MAAGAPAPNAPSENPGSLAKSKRAKKTERPAKAKSQVKSRRSGAAAGDDKKQKKKKQLRKYTAEELGVPKLNGIVPTGVQKLRGKKKGKVFVDDADSMLAILGMVQAEKEGEREGKITKARRLEEIREAKRIEAEKRLDVKKSKFEEVKDQIKRNKRRKSHHNDSMTENDESSRPTTKKKRVSFG